MTDAIEPLLLALWQDMRDMRILWQVAIIAASLAIAGWLSYRMQLRRRPRPHAGDGSTLEIGLGGLRRLAFPLAALTLVLFGRWALAHFQTGVSLLSVAVPLLTARA